MKKLIPFAAALLIALPAAADEVVRTLERQFSAAEATRIHLEFPVGELKIEAGSGREVEVHVDLKCDSKRKTRCVEATKVIELVGSTGDRLHVELKGWPKSGSRGMEADVRVTVPRDLPLQADLGVGELGVSGMEADLSVDLGVGDVNIVMPESAVRSVSVDTGVGDANVYAAGQHIEGSGFISKDVKWTKGEGKARVSVDLGVGDAEVRLQ